MYVEMPRGVPPRGAVSIGSVSFASLRRFFVSIASAR
jgi:hypothetical protein